MSSDTYDKSNSSNVNEQFVATANLHLFAAYVGEDPALYIAKTVVAKELSTSPLSEADLDNCRIQFLYGGNEVTEPKIPFSQGAFL